DAGSKVDAMKRAGIAISNSPAALGETLLKKLKKQK
ncbi:MAG TPA: succinate--CoA ligase subunit alpha, partial [Aestuariivirga sp.]